MLHHFTEDRREALTSAKPERAITLFYDQAIEHLLEAISAIARNAIAERCNATTATIEILGEMIQCMELEPGDEVGLNIERIHRFIIAGLPKVNLYNDAKFAAECVRLLRPLRDAFAAIERETDAVEQQLALRQTGGTGRPQLSLVTPAG